MKKNEIKTGIQWNLVSYVFLGIFTILSYWLITEQYGKAALGAYNIVLSIFMICGHIGVFGLQSAAIYFIPQQLGDKRKLGQYFSSFALIVIAASGILAAVIFLSAEFVATQIFDSEYIFQGLHSIPLAVILFSVNKMIGGFINGLGEMRKFAILQGSRYFLIVSFIGINTLLKQEFGHIFNAFFLSELGVLLIGIRFLVHRIRLCYPDKICIRSGIRFGFQAMLGNVISDVNTRVDVMMLGILCSDAIVGLYSFVTIIAEGMFSILFVFRNNYNPHFADLLFHKKIAELTSLLKKQNKRLRLLFGTLGVVISIGYLLFCIIILENSYMASVPSVIIILAGCAIMAPYFVAGNICTLAGKPYIDTGITFVTILSNILLNYILILKFELSGAALATSISYLIYSLLMSRAIRKCVAS